MKSPARSSNHALIKITPFIPRKGIRRATERWQLHIEQDDLLTTAGVKKLIKRQCVFCHRYPFNVLGHEFFQ